MMQSSRAEEMARPWSLEGVEGMEAARGRSFPRVWGAVGAACALCGLVAWSSYGSVSEPSPASPLALYVPQMGVPKVQQHPGMTLEPQMAVPIAPQVPQVAVVDQAHPGLPYALAQP